MQLLHSFVLVAYRLEDGEKALQDVDDDRHHPCLYNSLADMLCAPDTDVNDTLKSQCPFEAIFFVIDFGVLEDRDQTLQAAVPGDELADGWG